MKITMDNNLGKLMTFELSKDKPTHGWFWYKEGFAPEIVEYAINYGNKIHTHKCDSKLPEIILDPFCGVGTTLLTAKQKNILSIGVDASQLAVFISKTKTDDYAEEDIGAVEIFVTNKLRSLKNTNLQKWQFELFDPRAVFPKRNYNQILAIREAIEQEEPRTRNLLLLALLSVLPQASIMLKDGGVLKIKKDKLAIPAKDVFKRKVKRMVRELRERDYSGYTPEVFIGDARALETPTESIDLIVTSPPYLNNIDYSKVYGIELSLLHMSKAEAEEVRMRAIRSFIGKDMKVNEMPEEVGELGNQIPIVGSYFKDMEQAIMEMFRVLSSGSCAHVIVSNSIIHNTHVIVDEIFAEMAERIGFSDVEIIVGAERVADVRPQKVKTRESIVVMRK
ncbi:site-specific DNA-methyltransferase [Candidatus Micrarchaeota archaeon]|nr:site-specific DNA-methyltransferase [Candidatus Micrarchaeota archaeon]MBU1166026.1 site-specific DNA-methyltransferase [Candidatus Micrarchaeota archaeon]MBU1886359.1 site-specific DNA-methyltransferase [Candidatus Micrarchaeota archaeon]